MLAYTESQRPCRNLYPGGRTDDKISGARRMTMLTILDSFADGPLDWVKTMFVPYDADAERVVPAGRLLTPEGARDLLSAYLAAHDAAEHRARVSMWSQWYFARLLPVWVIVNLSHQWQLPISADRVWFQLNEDGLPLQFMLQGDGEPVTETDPLVRFAGMVQHIAPVCQILADLAGLKPGIFWNNAAVRIQWGIEQAELINADVTPGQALLTARTLCDGSKNALFEPTRREIPTDAASPSFRRQCCLRYELCDHEMCPSCPLLLAEKRRRPATV